MKIKPYSSNRVMITTEKGICISVSDDGNVISIQRHSTDTKNDSALKIEGEFYNYEEHFANDQTNPIKGYLVKIR